MKSKELFTGERFVPGIGDHKLEIEHFQRYLSVREIVKGKRVLDAACGEGYGSNILAGTAKDVIGIDIDEGAVNRAVKLYGHKDNLCFEQGNIESLNLQENSIDVVVSFETIEHVDEETQKKFLYEISRVLKTDGILIMSTPNKAVYSDRHDYQNEFHKKEFYHDEFITFLHRKFQYVQLYNQAFCVLSIIDRCDRSDETVCYYSHDKEYNNEGKYYIAVASNNQLSALPLASLYVDNLNEYEKNISRILSLQKEEDARNRHIEKLNVELKEYGNLIRKLQKENTERNEHIHYLDTVIEKKDHMLSEYRTEIDHRKQQLEVQEQLNDTQFQKIAEQSELIAQQTGQILRQAADVDRFAQQSIEKSEQIERQYEENAEQKKIIDQQVIEIRAYERKMAELVQESEIAQNEHEQQIAALIRKSEITQNEYEQQIAAFRQESEIARGEYEQRIAALEQMASNEKNDHEQRVAVLEKTVSNKQKEYEQTIAVLEQTVRNKEGHIEQLLETERAFEREKKTHSYKIGKRLQQFGNFLLPPDSARRFFARVMFNIFRHPILMFHVINPTRIKRYFKYRKNADMEGIKRGFGEAVRTEKMSLSGNDIEEVPVLSAAVDHFDQLAFPAVRKPAVSIIIPVYNEFQYTYNCLVSILNNTGDVPYEVIIADDCSTDQTKEIADIVSGIRVVTTKKNLRFLLNCNHAAKYAKGKYIVFLNNDTQVQENWLQPLVRLIESDEGIGMVGSKLIYPDGYLQEAGGILWKDGSAWNYGNRKNPEDPEYNYVKEADYISGAAIMIKRTLWNKIGGFDERFAPAYCEDSDLAFAVRAYGYKVLYQPLSVVVHFEGISNGTDLTDGQKMYQIKNQQKLTEKWKDVLEREHFPNAENVFVARDRNRSKPVLLMVDHYVPQYDKDAGSRTVFQYLKMFVEKGYNVKFIGDNFYRHEPYTTTLQQMGIEVLYGPYYAQNWKEWLMENGAYIQYVFLNRPHIAVKYIDFIRENTKAKIIYYGHDLHFLRELRRYELTHDKQALADSQDWKEKELCLMRKADVVYYPSNIETDEIKKIDRHIKAKAIVAYIYEHVEAKPYQFDQRKDIMFIGGFTHTPNVDAAIWFGREIMPKIVAAIPDIKWYVMGSNPPQEVAEMAGDHIIVKGFVTDEELERYYSQCRMSVVPLRYGAGIKGKVIEAMRYGMPVVTTPVGAEGIDGAEDILCIADANADAVAKEMIAKYNNIEYLKQISAKSCEYIRKIFSQENAWNVIKDDFQNDHNTNTV